MAGNSLRWTGDLVAIANLGSGCAIKTSNLQVGTMVLGVFFDDKYHYTPEAFCTDFLLPTIYFWFWDYRHSYYKDFVQWSQRYRWWSHYVGEDGIAVVTIGDKKGNWSQCATMWQHIFFKYAASFLAVREGIANNSIWSSQTDKILIRTHARQAWHSVHLCTICNGAHSTTTIELQKITNSKARYFH